MVFSSPPALPVLGLATAVVVVAGVFVLAGGRQPDPSGDRVHAIYVFTVSLITLFVLLFAAAGFIRSLTLAIGLRGERPVPVMHPLASPQPFAPIAGNMPSSVPSSAGSAPTAGEPAPGMMPGGSSAGMPAGMIGFGPSSDSARHAVRTAVAALVAGLVLWFHALQAKGLIAGSGFAASPARRVYRAHLYSACLGAVLAGIAGAVAFASGVFGAIWPSTLNTPFPMIFAAPTPRSVGIAQALFGSVMAIGALAIFRFHWTRIGTLRDSAAPAGES